MCKKCSKLNENGKVLPTISSSTSLTKSTCQTGPLEVRMSLVLADLGKWAKSENMSKKSHGHRSDKSLCANVLNII